jgi:hypothetical protein
MRRLTTALIVAPLALLYSCADVPTHYTIYSNCDDKPDLKYVVRWDEVDAELAYHRRAGCNPTSEPYRY